MRKKKLLGWLVVGGVAVAAAAALRPAEEARMLAAPQPAAQPAKGEPRREPSAFALPSRDGLSRPRGDLFASSAPLRPPAAPAQPQPAAEAAAPAPVAPPMPYRVAGQVVHDGPAQVVLARDDRVYIAQEGEVLDGGYRVESIRSDGVTLLYTPLDIRQHLAAVSSLEVAGADAAQPSLAKPLQLAEGRPAQLRWEGPARVQAGSNFDVALKITSDKPVRGSPLQLSYDAKLLEPVSVRAGGFFVDGSFTYRVNPGSIFVGAFGKGEVPADAEFLVVTFRPIRAGATAELKLSSMVLQGPSGSALGHEPLAAFRTSITQ